MRKKYSSLVKSETTGEPSDDNILQACTALNLRINQQIKALIHTYQKDPLLCAAFSPENLIEQLDPLLVQCIQILTKPTRERRQLFNQDSLFDASGTVKTKTMKQPYCLSTLFFCTNSQCNMPLQYLLSDVVLCLGGINRIGAVSSLDTHDRVATYAVSERIAQGIHSELQPQTLTVTSIDNIDILQRHAMVSSTESKRSWHGTSVQCVQPLPKGIVLSNLEFSQTQAPLPALQKRSC